MLSRRRGLDVGDAWGDSRMIEGEVILVGMIVLGVVLIGYFVYAFQEGRSRGPDDSNL